MAKNARNDYNHRVQRHIAVSFALFLIIASASAVLVWKLPGTSERANLDRETITQTVRPEISIFREPTEIDSRSKLPDSRPLGQSSDPSDSVLARTLESRGIGSLVEQEVFPGVCSDQRTIQSELPSRILAESPSPDALRRLFRTIRNEKDDDTRRVLVSSLHDVRDPAAVPVLLEELRQRRDPITYPVIRDTVARIADERGVWAVVDAYRKATADGSQQVSVLRALARITRPDAVPALQQIVLKADEDTVVRSQAALALGRIGDALAVNALETAFEAATSQSMALTASESLASVVNKDAAGELAVLLLNSKHVALRSAAARALANMPTDESIRALLVALERERESEARQVISRVLERLGQDGKERPAPR